MELVPLDSPWVSSMAATVPRISLIPTGNGHQEWFRWIKALVFTDCYDELKYWCGHMRWDKKFCSCLGSLHSCGKTSGWNPTAGKVPGTRLSAANSGKRSVSNVVLGLMKVRLEYISVGKIKPNTGNTGVILQQNMTKFSMQTKGSCNGVALVEVIIKVSFITLSWIWRGLSA